MCKYFSFLHASQGKKKKETSRCFLKSGISYFCKQNKRDAMGPKECDPQITTTPLTTTTTTTTTTSTASEDPDDKNQRIQIPGGDENILGPLNLESTVAIFAGVGLAFLVVTLFFLQWSGNNKSKNIKDTDENKTIEPSRPISISSFVRSVESGDIPKPDEYEDLNQLDFRLHVVRLSNKVGRGYQHHPNGPMNRYNTLITFTKQYVLLFRLQVRQHLALRQQPRDTPRSN